MSPVQLTSGDLLADRRAAYARMLSDAGDINAAADLMAQALELAPAWAAGWHQLGLYREKAGDIAGAADAFRQVLVLEPGDIFGAGLKLALAGEADIPAAPPSGYVAQLFDDYADRFDAALTGVLAYAVPARLKTMILEQAGAGAHFARVIDLGCGTGLFGAQIRTFASRLEGYDLSAGMLAKAAEKGIYDHLAQANIAVGLDTLTGPTAGLADLVVAADVFAYFGDLEPVVSVAVGFLASQGLLAFSVEAGDGEARWRLQPSLRYCHGEAYLRALLDRQGLDVAHLVEEPIRRDGTDVITGFLVIARKRLSDIVRAEPPVGQNTLRPANLSAGIPRRE